MAKSKTGIKVPPIKVPPLTAEMYRRGKETYSPSPLDAMSVRYDRKRDAIDLRLRNGIEISLPRTHIIEIENATSAELATIEVQPDGEGISVDCLNVDISVAGLLADELRPLFARDMGRKSRGRTSVQKAKASRKNGLKGGRPKAKAGSR